MINGEPLNVFGRILKGWREDRDMTIVQLSHKLAKCGYVYHFSTLSNYENGRRYPSGEFFAHLAECVGMTESDAAELISLLGKEYTVRLVREYQQAISKKGKA
jgi:transcriptional regulator with XRE-family HTH domain